MWTFKKYLEEYKIQISTPSQKCLSQNDSFPTTPKQQSLLFLTLTPKCPEIPENNFTTAITSNLLFNGSLRSPCVRPFLREDWPRAQLSPGLRLREDASPPPRPPVMDKAGGPSCFRGRRLTKLNRNTVQGKKCSF